jgi:H/ACA ribonucleoprotein complex subunit 1
MNQVYFTVKPAEGIVATSFKRGDKVFIGGDKLLPLDRFLPKPKSAGVKRPNARGRGGGIGAPRGRGGFSRGSGRGGARGGPMRGSARGGIRGGRALSGGFRGRGRG